MTKDSLRKEYLEKRDRFTKVALDGLSTRLTNDIYDFIIESKSSVVFLFLPIADKNEFDSFALIQRLWEAGVKVCVPVSNFKTKTMIPVSFTSETSLEQKKYGILEPQGKKEVDCGKIDLALVPLLVSDMKKNRLGYGGGFYDRFLSENKHIYKLGVSFFEPIDEIPGLGVHDVSLDKVIY